MKKKVTFSKSGGTPAMLFLNNIKELFGSNELELIASKIASTCMNTDIRIEHGFKDGIMEIVGSNALCIRVTGNILVLKADNITVMKETLTFK
jgi:hypothetical protein